MFVVQKRDAATLIPIILNNVKHGTEIISDEWRAYNGLKAHGYKHYRVNHSKNFVNPRIGRHTQLIECLWSVAKSTIMKRGIWTSGKNLPGHLAEQWFRSKSIKSSIFRETLTLISKQNEQLIANKLSK